MCRFASTSILLSKSSRIIDQYLSAPAAQITASRATDGKTSLSREQDFTCVREESRYHWERLLITENGTRNSTWRMNLTRLERKLEALSGPAESPITGLTNQDARSSGGGPGHVKWTSQDGRSLGTDQSGGPGQVELAQLGVQSLLLRPPGVTQL